MNNIPNGKQNPLRYWQPIVFMVTIIFGAGSVYNMQKVNAAEIEDLKDSYKNLNVATTKIPLMEKDITYIKEKQEAMSATQDRMLQEQRIVLKSLIRIEAKI